jgi:hypothetical protein
VYVAALSVAVGVYSKTLVQVSSSCQNPKHPEFGMLNHKCNSCKVTCQQRCACGTAIGYHLCFSACSMLAQVATAAGQQLPMLCPPAVTISKLYLLPALVCRTAAAAAAAACGCKLRSTIGLR